jgi:hypothetical protein
MTLLMCKWWGIMIQMQPTDLETATVALFLSPIYKRLTYKFLYEWLASHEPLIVLYKFTVFLLKQHKGSNFF